MLFLDWLYQRGPPIIGTAFICASFCFFWVGFLLWRGSHNEYERNRARVKKSIQNVIFGTVPTSHDGVRDDKVSAGIALDKNNGRWVEQGRLSDEALEDILAP